MQNVKNKNFRSTYECCGYGGKWKYPEGIKKHKIYCVADNETPETTVKPETPKQEKLCPDLKSKYFDDSVQVPYTIL